MPANSKMIQKDEVDDLEFKWGKKKGRGGVKKDVQFYHSFSYDGIEYWLYDSVYLYKHGEADPYIGKLIKIWEHASRGKKVKVLWFFRPSEILNYLGDISTLKNELFLGAGDGGLGLHNINPLEAIAGKCNVICISKDERNRQPSPEELNMADFVFYRTFNVDNFTISKELGEIIADIEVKFLLNIKNSQFSNNLRIESNSNGHRDDFVANGEKGMGLEKKDTGKTLEPDSNSGAVPMELKSAAEYSLETRKRPLDSNSDGTCAGKADPSNKDGVCGGNMSGLGSLDGQPSKKLKSDGCSRSTMNLGASATADKSNINELSNSAVVSNEKLTREHNKDSHEPFDVKSPVKSPDNFLDDRPSKKLKSAGAAGSSMQNVAFDSAGGKFKSPLPNAITGDNKLKRVVKDSAGAEACVSEKMVAGQKIKKLSDDKSHVAPSKQINKKDAKMYGRVVEVTRRPEADSEKWFTSLTWEEQMKDALEDETLVLLQNFNPTYTSSEIEDIVWHGFHENCTAKVIQCVARSSPHSGQAFAIFKTKQAAARVVRDLEEGCLMLPNGRPLLGRFGTAHFPGKSSSFPGHYCIDKLKFQMQKKDQREAVSTSHSSQPSTLEYDMAMEWRTLQERSEFMWRKLFKKQGEELKKLRGNLSRKI